MKKISSRPELYTEFVRDMYSAEVQEVPALRFFEKRASSPALATLLHRHVGETRMQLLRLEELIDRHGKSLIEDHCRTMQSMITEAKELVNRCETGPLRDFAIVASVQRIKHCEMLVYRMLIQMADELGFRFESEMLEQNLQEEFGMLDALPSLSQSTRDNLNLTGIQNEE